MNRIAAVFVGLSLAFVGTSTAFATTHTVCSSGCDYTSIQDAISASVNGDIIAIEAGMYYEANLNPGGKAITIGSASGNLDVTIDAQQGGSVFVFQTGETSETVIKDLLITGGIGTLDGGYRYGGGIYCKNNSNPTITGCTISRTTRPASAAGSPAGTAAAPPSPAARSRATRPTPAAGSTVPKPAATSPSPAARSRATRLWAASWVAGSSAMTATAPPSPTA